MAEKEGERSRHVQVSQIHLLKQHTGGFIPERQEAVSTGAT